MNGNKCVVCHKCGMETCSCCGMVSYCGRENEKEHWLYHKEIFKPYKIEQSPLIGRYMIASREIKAGELIVKESPMVMGPRMDSVALCLGCYKTEIRLCSNCNVAPICSPECEIISEHAGLECKTFAKFLKLDSDFSCLTSRMEIVMPLRCLLMRLHNRISDKKWEEFLKLEYRSIARGNNPVWHGKTEKIVNVLEATGIISTSEDANLVRKICRILDVNSFELRGPNPALMTHSLEFGKRLRGVYMEAALLSHDCIGNTHIAVDDDYTMNVHASDPIKAGDPILFNYATSLESTSERRLRMKEGKCFSCECKRCSDPTELGTYMGSIICSRCRRGLVIPDNPLQKEDIPDSWRCEECKHKFHFRSIKATVNQAWSEVENSDNTNFKDLEILLKRISRTLPQSNAVILEIKQNLVALYRDIILRESNPSRKILHRKITLCSELLRVLNVVEPGISRLKGITLYELHVPMVFLANREYESGEITGEILLSRLSECEKILKEAVSMLLYEPCNSPEGRLLRVAIDQLRILRGNIQDFKLLDSKTSRNGGKKRRNGKKN